VTALRRSFALACVSAAITAACGGAAVAPSPTASAAPTETRTLAPLPTQAPTLYSYVADLKSSNEVPPIADAEASCAGQAKITLSVLIDSAYYNVTSGKATFDVALTGCPATTQVVLAHIHAGAATANGPVKVDTGLVSSQPIAFGTGVTIKKADITVDPAVADDLIQNPGNYYFNVHTQAHGGGVVRGQLVATR
jgi:hypothetical protein